jgi:predicted HicB family RNase H-like nuclease
MKDKQINIRIPADLHKALRIKAAELGISLTELINNILLAKVKK